jgi:hypothetical protein
LKNFFRLELRPGPRWFRLAGPPEGCLFAEFIDKAVNKNVNRFSPIRNIRVTQMKDIKSGEKELTMAKL